MQLFYPKSLQLLLPIKRMTCVNSTWHYWAHSSAILTFPIFSQSLSIFGKKKESQRKYERDLTFCKFEPAAFAASSLGVRF